jgi:hypothetical protein
MPRLHSKGLVYRADVVPLASDEPLGSLAQRLRGDAWVRLSGAWWRGTQEWKDVLGCAVRFLASDKPDGDGQAGDQDLLFATARRPWLAIFALFTTDPHDFLENDYYAASPYHVHGVGKVRWRLVPHRARESGRNRWQKLERAVKNDLAAFRLEIKRLGAGDAWQPVAELRLKERVSVDSQSLRFSPLMTGRGFQPQRFLRLRPSK